MIPAAEMMLKLAVTIEATAAKRGWDEAPMLAVIFRQVVPGPRGHLFEVVPFPKQPQDISPDPAQGLLWLAGVMLTENPPPIIPAGRRDDLAGVAFLGEGWMRDDVDTLDGAGRARRFADIPGSKETRFVHLVDCAGRYHFVNRVRGQQPTSLTVNPGDARFGIRGNITIGLRDLLLALAKEMPFGSVDLDAVRTIGTEGMADLIAEAEAET